MKKYVLNIAVLLLVCLSSHVLVSASDHTDVRATVQSVFEQLKAHDYNALYDLLPASSRSRMSSPEAHTSANASSSVKVWREAESASATRSRREISWRGLSR